METKKQIEDIVINECLNYYGFSEDVLKDESRQHGKVICRQTITWLIYVKCQYTMAQIGRIFDCHHSTIIHRLQCANSDMALYPSYREEVSNLSYLIDLRLDYGDKEVKDMIYEYFRKFLPEKTSMKLYTNLVNWLEKSFKKKDTK